MAIVRWFKLIRVQVILALVAQFVLTWSLIVHSLNISEQQNRIYSLLASYHTLESQLDLLRVRAESYLLVAPRDYESYERDVTVMSGVLSSAMAAIHAQLQQIKMLAPQNPESIKYSNRVSRRWHWLSQDFKTALGSISGAPRLEGGVTVLVRALPGAIDNVRETVVNLEVMGRTLKHKLEFFQRRALAASVLLIVVLTLLMMWRLGGPVRRLAADFRKIARGDLDGPIEFHAENELSEIVAAGNQIASRLRAIFDFNEAVSSALSIEQYLPRLFDALGRFVPIKAVALVEYLGVGREPLLAHFYSNNQIPSPSLIEPMALGGLGPLLSRVEQLYQPFSIELGAQNLDGWLRDVVLGGVCGAFFQPVQCDTEQRCYLVFMAEGCSIFDGEVRQLMLNFGSQISRSLNQATVSEGLVISAIEGLARLAESRDPETGDHLYRMSRYAAIIADTLRVSQRHPQVDDRFVRDMLRFAPMHDIGKVGIKDGILLKPGKLSQCERREMERHPVIGAQVLQRCEEQMNSRGISIFGIGIEIAEAHHEKWDGSGYPYGLQQAQIPLSARIVAAADVFDALTSKRSYKAAWPVARAMELMHREGGSHFDPDVMDALERAMPAILEVYEKYKHV